MMLKMMRLLTQEVHLPLQRKPQVAPSNAPSVISHRFSPLGFLKALEIFKLSILLGLFDRS